MGEGSTEGGGAARVFLDACVLFPPLVRSILLSLAERGVFEPFWSQRVLDEWRLSVVRKYGLSVEAEIMAAQDAMMTRFETAMGEADPDFEALIELPDPADAHVLAAAHALDAKVLLTFNLRDFPRRALARTAITVRHPDEFLWDLLSGSPSPVAAATAEALAGAEVPPDRTRQVLKRARLPRFGKALVAYQGNPADGGR
ncbi:MAG: PIN domain-containing protein [Pseudomonadota bacterium]